MKQVIAAILLLGLIAAPVLAQDFLGSADSPEVRAAIGRLTEFQNDPACAGIRGGGGSGKKLGVYNMGKDSEFHSKEYMELDPAIKARWAVSLYKFIELKGGGWEAALNWNMNKAQGDPTATDGMSVKKENMSARRSQVRELSNRRYSAKRTSIFVLCSQTSRSSLGPKAPPAVVLRAIFFEVLPLEMNPLFPFRSFFGSLF